MENHDHSYDRNAVSIITCTKRQKCMDTLFRNYARQSYRNKELIVILNHKNLKITEYIKAARKYKNVTIYSLPDETSLGRCLSYGVERANCSFIAKFDDDDYYAPDYLTDSMRIQRQTNADIVGKRAHYMYLSGKKLLLLRYPNKENQASKSNFLAIRRRNSKDHTWIVSEKYLLTRNVKVLKVNNIRRFICKS
ncbi:glycosyltransferase [Paenibacillus jilunlii]|uniref:Glycosyl transferase family 2 n=3 Tax=Paenibacillus jilunlii TaxID=682956 RepID=A0A1G9TQ81_9BACL|nr:glycosyltransferase [Paenibacillus jilunlii]KWX71917.1 hypothetical protein AML91_22500 [Paenibacillus jilunlii]SDM49812.1 Glycosyl transferase family 2 [Paenibacillus jilunlii]